jgi:hypothetical protein
MFENGSYLRRRKRFKVKQNQLKKSDDDDGEEKSIKSIRKTSFLIDNLLANDTSIASSSSSSETNQNLQQLVYINDYDLIRQLTFHNQQLYW